MSLTRSLALFAAALMPCAAAASDLNGAELSVFWALPFAGILLSIALGPLLVPHFWHHNFGKVSVFWALCCAVPLFIFETAAAPDAIAHVLIADYIPFILFVGALFVVAGGIHIRGSFVGRPVVNACFLLCGAFFANLMGTTGSAMLLIRPLIAANEGRKYKTHTFIFFVFIVANIGGCLTPLGDPPLFLGFLRGVEFFWTTGHLIVPLLVTLAILTAVYLAIDGYFYRREVKEGTFVPNADQSVPFGISGKVNILYLLGIVCSVLMSGIWRPGIEFEVLHVHLPLQGIVRDCLFIAFAAASLVTTSREVRSLNQFTWAPILEVAKLFFGIFICIVPVLGMLRAGHQGAFAPLVALVTNDAGEFNNMVFFWLTGGLSAFLDNAPTYLAFFNLAGGNAVDLMTVHSHTLMAVSMGAVFMGAMTYIGNAPNFMTVAICNERGIRMPTFFGYMFWSVGILVPTFFVIDLIFL